MIPAKAITSYNYRSYFVSPWNVWFEHMGYPELDVIEYPDGEKAVIEYLKAPTVPALTPWNFTLTKLRNMELTYDWLKAWADQKCLERRHVWEEQAKLEERLRQDQLAEDRRSEDFVTRAHAAVVNNPDLMQRVGKNGLGELHPFKLLKHVPKSRLGY